MLLGLDDEIETISWLQLLSKLLYVLFESFFSFHQHMYHQIMKTIEKEFLLDNTMSFNDQQTLDNISECSNFVEQDVLSDSQFGQYLDYLSDFSEFDIDSVLLKDDENLFHGTLSPLPLQVNLNNDVKLQAYLHQYTSQRKTLVFGRQGLNLIKLKEDIKVDLHFLSYKSNTPMKYNGSIAMYLVHAESDFQKDMIQGKQQYDIAGETFPMPAFDIEINHFRPSHTKIDSQDHGEALGYIFRVDCSSMEIKVRFNVLSSDKTNKGNIHQARQWDLIVETKEGQDRIRIPIQIVKEVTGSTRDPASRKREKRYSSTSNCNSPKQSTIEKITECIQQSKTEGISLEETLKVVAETFMVEFVDLSHEEH